MRKMAGPGLCASLIALFVGGCVEELQPLPSRFTDVVQVSRHEPRRDCRPIGAIEGRSRESDRVAYESAYESLRTNAALRGGNYVVIDLLHTVSFGASQDPSIVINGRLYDCAPGLPTSMVTVSRPMAPQACTPSTVPMVSDPGDLQPMHTSE